MGIDSATRKEIPQLKITQPLLVRQTLYKLL